MILLNGITKRTLHRIDLARLSDAMGSMFGEGGLFGVDSPAINVNPTNYENSELSMDFSLFDDNPANPTPASTGVTTPASYSPPTATPVQIDRYQVHR